MTNSSNHIITITKGLDVPIAGTPKAIIDGRLQPQHVALLGEDYVGLKPSMLVEVGDKVAKGQPLFADKKTPGVCFTAPAAGEIVAIHRGERRVLQSVVIRVSGNEQVCFNRYDDVTSLSRAEVTQNLLDSGLWTAMRTRPFSKVPAPNAVPAAIFVTAIDTNPLAADPRQIIAEHPQAFEAGLVLLTKLTDGKLFLCQDDNGHLPGQDLPNVHNQRFGGVHPAGLVGTHIHHLMPVSLERTVWHIGYQDVIAYGKLFQTGELYTDRIVSLAGPSIINPRLIRTPIGAELSPNLSSEISGDLYRIVSGSVLSGHKADDAHDFLGRFHNQISALPEDNQRQLLPWAKTGRDRFSITRTMLSLFSPNKKFDMTTSAGGDKRAIVAMGQLERVMPLDILPTILVRDLIAQDTDEAQQLGALELDEEDLALCTFVCPGKYDFGKELRTCLEIIEKEG
ncbi:Na(+)-translocating NADH-quinone reductase subunit A [Ferrimonas lipolytica]|uniref:Na(+)-translocating NADH-quinone reductase subunit A n=1 Tax=Ferrimonas lipolytica TaxID=2724191 RepID=A0A6H1UAJ1_9GAMM|nr:Na(+)-translocating NADH-quinone reductase subunit A [Ferrimonas lipolytica]QIZ76077.1 Na(+)-translocating NADH-quinone reductase subunit A [Ferrimonas lipolytica]